MIAWNPVRWQCLALGATKANDIMRQHEAIFGARLQRRETVSHRRGAENAEDDEKIKRCDKCPMPILGPPPNTNWRLGCPPSIPHPSLTGDPPRFVPRIQYNSIASLIAADLPVVAEMKLCRPIRKRAATRVASLGNVVRQFRTRATPPYLTRPINSP
jgi:hypothetical protein